MGDVAKGKYVVEWLPHNWETLHNARETLRILVDQPKPRGADGRTALGKQIPAARGPNGHPIKQGSAVDVDELARQVLAGRGPLHDELPEAPIRGESPRMVSRTRSKKVSATRGSNDERIKQGSIEDVDELAMQLLAGRGPLRDNFAETSFCIDLPEENVTAAKDIDEDQLMSQLLV